MDPGTALAVVQVSTKALSALWKYYADVKGAKEEFHYLTNELQSLHDVMEKLLELLQKPPTVSKIPITTSLTTTITQSMLDIKALEEKLDPGTGAKVMKRFGKRALEWPFAKNEVDEWVQKLQRVKGTVNVALNIDQTSLLLGVDANVTQLRHGQDAIEQERLLSKLPVAGDAKFDSYHRQHEPTCTSGTRVELLQQLEDWIQHHQRPIFWLSGMAGTGKSTISRTLAAMFQAQKTLGGSFFFSRGSGEANTAVNFVGTLVQQMASLSPHLKQYICEAISEHGEALRQGLRNQWKEFLIEPLQKLSVKNLPPVNIVIDALDECGSDQEIRLLLQLLVEAVDLKAINLAIFVTSRPEIPIRYGFKEMPQIMHHDLDLRDIPRETVEQDIITFLKHQFVGLSRQLGLHDWPSERDIHGLAQKADCLFIYAATAFRFLSDEDWNPSERLSEILRIESDNESATAQLDDMYKQVLRHSLVRKGRHETDIKKSCERFKQVVGPIVLLFNELGVSELAQLLSLPIGTIELCLNSLYSVLDVPTVVGNSIRLLHPSFHDFLVSEDRCQDKRFWIHQSLVHSRLAERCLETLSSALPRNAGQLSTPGSSPQEAQPDALIINLPKHVRYACRYWVDHLVHTEAEDRVSVGLCDSGKVHDFFLKDFLHWFEAMSLLGQTPDVVRMITKLLSILKYKEHPVLYEIVQDARRFSLENRGVIEQAPLQAYTSALVFSPAQSLIRQCYSSAMPDWLVRLPDVERKWSNCVQTLEIPGVWNVSISFSPDGLYLASTSGKNIILWDTTTGAILNTMGGQENYGPEVTFLPDGHLVSCYSGKGTIRLWDPLTGVLRRMLDESGKISIRLYDWTVGLAHRLDTNYQYSSDDEYFGFVIALSSENMVALSLEDAEGRIEVHNLAKNSRKTLSGQSGGLVKALVFSANGDILVSGFHDGTLWMWQVTSGSQAFIGVCSLGLNEIAISPDGKRIAVSGGSFIQLWDLPVEEFSYDTLDVTQVESLEKVEQIYFSPNGKQTASFSHNSRNVQIHNPGTGALVHVLSEPTGFLKNIKYSPDGAMLTSANVYGAIRLWNAHRGIEHRLLDTGGSESYSRISLAFSHDAKRLCSCVYNGLTRVWDTKTGQMICELASDSDPGGSLISWSHDNNMLATSSLKNVQIWVIPSGELLAKIEYGDQYISNLFPTTFAPNGKFLAYGTEDCIMIFDLDTKKSSTRMDYTSFAFSLNELAISSDNEYVAAAYDEISVSHIYIWNVKSTQRVAVVKDIGSPSYIHEMSFSPDGLYLETNHGYIPTQAPSVVSERVHGFSPWAICGWWEGWEDPMVGT
ncbi:MAG: hypothetical protein Q9170_004770 [Blastenia crenularia]